MSLAMFNGLLELVEMLRCQQNVEVGCKSVGSIQRSSSLSKALSSNALPETGMTNEGIEFAATMLALAGIAMMRKEKRN